MINDTWHERRSHFRRGGCTKNFFGENTLPRYVSINFFQQIRLQGRGNVRPDPINVAMRDKLNDALRDTRWKRFLIN